MRKAFGFAVCCLLILLGSSACSSGDSNQATESSASSEPANTTNTAQNAGDSANTSESGEAASTTNTENASETVSEPEVQLIDREQGSHSGRAGTATLSYASGNTFTFNTTDQCKARIANRSSFVAFQGNAADGQYLWFSWNGSKLDLRHRESDENSTWFADAQRLAEGQYSIAHVDGAGGEFIDMPAKNENGEDISVSVTVDCSLELP